MDKQIIFIFGCQRSGTSATLNGLDQLNNVKIYSETNDIIHSKAQNGSRIRLKKPRDLRRIFKSEEKEILVLKPLVEAQNAKILLDAFPGSKGLWLYRNFKEVVSSLLKKWNGLPVGQNMLHDIIKSHDNWKSENVHFVFKQMLQELDRSELTKFDYAALFWIVRNKHFFLQRLHFDERVRLIKYSNLVNESNYLFNSLATLGIAIPKQEGIFHNKSVGKGRRLEFNPIINYMCKDVLDRLNSCHRSQIKNNSSQLETVMN